MTKLHLVTISAAAFGFVLTGCQQEASAPAEEAPTTATDNTLPISINAAMVALTDSSSDYIFAPGNGDMPKDDADWDKVRNAAYDMMIAGKVLQMPGTGQFDAQWVAEDDWKAKAEELTAIGGDALQLAEAKSTDEVAWRAVGDRLVQNCLTCHEKFKPETPSQGILHAASKRESLGESVFD